MFSEIGCGGVHELHEFGVGAVCCINDRGLARASSARSMRRTRRSSRRRGGTTKVRRPRTSRPGCLDGTHPSPVPRPEPVLGNPPLPTNGETLGSFPPTSHVGRSCGALAHRAPRRCAGVDGRAGVRIGRCPPHFRRTGTKSWSTTRPKCTPTVARAVAKSSAAPPSRRRPPGDCAAMPASSPWWTVPTASRSVWGVVPAAFRRRYDARLPRRAAANTRDGAGRFLSDQCCHRLIPEAAHILHRFRSPPNSEDAPTAARRAHPGADPGSRRRCNHRHRPDDQVDRESSEHHTPPERHVRRD